METTRLEHLHNASEITFIAFMVWEIQKSQGVTFALTEDWNSFCCTLFSTKLAAESEKVFCKEVVGNFVSFPTV
jgi:hypothetical protein